MLNTEEGALQPLLALSLLFLRKREFSIQSMIQIGDWRRLAWGPTRPGQPHCTHIISPVTPFQLKSGSLGLLWAACSWIIVQIFWADLGPNSCLMIVELSVGPISVTTPLDCCGTASPGLCPHSASGLHDPWSLTLFFMPPLLKPHQSTPSTHVQEPHFSLLDCWWDLLLSKLLLCSPFPDMLALCPNSKGTALSVLWSPPAHLPSWSSLEIAPLWQSVRIVGEKEVC